LSQIQGEAHEAMVGYCKCALTQIEDPGFSGRCDKIGNRSG
jgi:hypothetical protein